MWKDSIRNIVVIFQTKILRIVVFYVRRSANVFALGINRVSPVFFFILNELISMHPCILFYKVMPCMYVLAMYHGVHVAV